MRLYLDSNVLVAYLLEEMDRAFNLRFLESERFFDACKKPNIEIVIFNAFFE